MSNDIDQFLKENRKFIKIADGESFEGIYKGCKKHPDRFNVGQDTMSYMFQDPDTGKVIPWTNKSMKVALKMQAFKENDCLKVTRIGSDMKNTDYAIVKSSDEKVPF